MNINQPPDTSIRSILVHPEDNNTIYVSLEKAYDKIINPVESYLFKTENGGQSWVEMFPPNPVRILGIHPGSTSDIVYVAYGNMLYKTSDNGFTWIRIDPNYLIPGESTGDFRDIAIDPDDGNILYLPPSSYGFFKSTTEGTSWNRVTHGLLNVAVVLMSVPNLVGSDTVYVTGWDGEGTYRTDNAGESWITWNEGLTTKFAGTNGNNVAQPMVQTTDGRYIYFGSADSGVFRRKAVGFNTVVTTGSCSTTQLLRLNLDSDDQFSFVSIFQTRDISRKK